MGPTKENGLNSLVSAPFYQLKMA